MKKMMTSHEPEVQRRPDRLVVAAAFACGALTGVTLALLVAPASGGDTRRHVREHAAAARDRTTRLVHERNAQAHAFIRRYGVIGLLRRQRTTSPTSGGDTPERLVATT